MSEIETGKRRRFQFSLRTLLLVVTLSAVFLSGAVVAGPCLIIPVTACLLWLLRLRIKWGYEDGLKIATLLVGGIMGGLGAVVAAAVLSPILACLVPLLCLIGLLAGFFGFLLVHAGVCLWTGKSLDCSQDAMEPTDDDAHSVDPNISRCPVETEG